MKIILVNHKNPSDINSFSGTSYFMSRAIKTEFETVLDYDDFETSATVQNVLAGHFRRTLKPIGRKLTSYLQKNDIRADFVICQGGNSSIPFYNHNIPIVFWHDSTWSSFLKKYDTKKNFNEFKATYKNLYLWDKKALDRSDLLIFSSEYVAESCLENYKLSEKKVKVVPFGANIFSNPSSDFLDEALKVRCLSQSLNLTFIGKDWRRKGLIDAYKLTKYLNTMKIKTKLTIVGCYPTLEYLRNSPYVKITGFLNKSDREKVKVFEDILQQTHFLIHPASSEPFGIVLCEANAYGIPILGTDIEGLKTIVMPGKNGYLFKRIKLVTEAYKILKNINYNIEENYSPLFYSSLEEFQGRLNWQVNVKKVKEILSDF